MSATILPTVVGATFPALSAMWRLTVTALTDRLSNVPGSNVEYSICLTVLRRFAIVDSSRLSSERIHASNSEASRSMRSSRSKSERASRSKYGLPVTIVQK